MQQFFLTDEKIEDHHFIVTGETFVHISKSLRLKSGEKVVFCDGKGYEYLCEICNFKNDSVVVKILSKSESNSEPKLKITIFQCLPKSDKFEDIIKRCVQYGAFEFVPVISERCIAKLNENKLQRLYKISKSAAMQSKRAIIPQVRNAVRFSDAIKLMCDFENAVICYENESQNTISKLSVKGNSFAALIGPEGGFSEQEAKLAIDNGIIPISLGKRLLRTEEAAAFLIPILLLKSGEI